MGNTCCAEQKEQVAEEVEKAVEQVKAVANEAQEMAADAKDQAKDVAQDAAETAKDFAQDAVEGIAEAAGNVQEKAGDLVDAVADAMTAAAAALKGVMYVEFDAGKGSIKTVEFKSKALGFTPALGGGGCCASSLTASVVGKVDKNGQADKLGVKKGWAVKAINGTEVTGLEEARRLLQEGADKISEA